ncbi:MAG TPA: aldo/keto reductase [Gemmatimonadaceae bacterium]
MKRTQTSKPKHDSARDTTLIPGHATPAGTSRFANRFADRFAADFFRSTSGGLTVSSIGMGTYLGECDDNEDQRYRDVITQGVTLGLNFVDTAINYRCQRSERAVGRALRSIVDDGVASRDEIVVCTKGGYVPLEGMPPESRTEYDSYLDEQYFAPSIMSKDDVVAGGHCVRPRFLADQIERSRHNLGLECIDLFYLHNPEQQLDSLDRSRFMSSITEAFAELERQVAMGHIRAYGCATWNGLRSAANARNHLSLGDLVTAAEKAGGKSHHFRFVQLPVNLAMTEAVRSQTQAMHGKPANVVDTARDLDISVIASASLMQSQLAQNLPPAVKSLFPDLSTDAQRAIAFVRSLPLSSALVGMRSLDHLKENLAAGSAVIRA